MFRAFALTVLLAGATAWAQAGQSDAGQAANDPSQEVAVSGCLQQSGAYLYLTQDDGTRIQVTGSKLGEYKGHEVELTGKRSSKAIDTTVTGAASSATLRPLFRVSSVKDLGSKCTKTSQ